jgi:hypothetical protein
VDSAQLRYFLEALLASISPTTFSDIHFVSFAAPSSSPLLSRPWLLFNTGGAKRKSTGSRCVRPTSKQHCAEHQGLCVCVSYYVVLGLFCVSYRQLPCHFCISCASVLFLQYFVLCACTSTYLGRVVLCPLLLPLFQLQLRLSRAKLLCTPTGSVGFLPTPHGAKGGIWTFIGRRRLKAVLRLVERRVGESLTLWVL